MGLFDGLLSGSFSFDPNDYTAKAQSLLAGLIPGGLAQAAPASAAPNFNDGYFSPQNFAPSQPTAFRDNRFDPQTYAPSAPAPGGTPFYGQSQNVAVGDYQMPVFGQPDANSAAIPQNAQPTAANVAQPQGVPDVGNSTSPSVLPSFLSPSAGGAGIGDRLSAGLINFANAGGPLQALASGVQGLATGQRNDAAGILQQNQRAQYAALLPILGPNKALLAVVNPDVGKALVTEALTNKEKYTKIGQDGLGREQYGFVNERDQTVNGKPVSQQPVEPAGGGLGNMDLTGKDYLASLPKAQANTIQLMVEGKIAPPSSFALSKPYWQNMIAAAKNYDPTFDATNWSARVAGAKDFSSGKSSEMVRSANQTLHHVGALLDSMDALKNSTSPIWNRIGNAVSEQMGSGAQGSFRTNAHAVAEELSKVFKGSNLSDAEIHAWEQNLHENMSPEQQRAQVGKLRDLLHGSLQALEEKRLAALGPIAAEKAGPIIKAESQKVLDRIDRFVKGNDDHGKDTSKPASAAIPGPAIAALKENPDRAAEFDAKYGSGAAAKVLGR